MLTETSQVIAPALYERLVAFRRDLHQHPELSWKEERTAGRVCSFLDMLGISYRNGISGTGIVAEIPGRCADRFVVLRADMDALPIVEELGYRSPPKTAALCTRVDMTATPACCWARQHCSRKRTCYQRQCG